MLEEDSRRAEREDERAPQNSRSGVAILRRASWAVAAVAVTGLLIGTLTFASTGGGAADLTDPTAVATAPPEREDVADRGTIRFPDNPVASRVLSKRPPVHSTKRPTTPSSQASTPEDPRPSTPAVVIPTGTRSSMPSNASEPTPSAVPTATTPSVPSPSASPELGEVVGSRWTTASVKVRTGPGTEFAVITTLGSGVEVEITNIVVDNRWQQVRVGGVTGFVPLKYLADKEDVPTETATPTSSEGAISKEPCKAAASIEAGLTPKAVDVLRAVCHEFPNVSGYEQAAGGQGSGHDSGNAIDVMISGEAGWEVANWVRANAGSLGVTEVIYAQKVWSSSRADEGWRTLPDAGNDTANHFDHVHISVQ